MSTTVNYKGSTIATVKNGTKTLTTSGKWLEGDIQLVDVTPGKYVATIKSTGSGGKYVRYDGISYYTTGETFAYNAGDSLFITATDSMGGFGAIYIDDVRVVATQGSASYTYTLPESNIDINFGSNSASVNTVPAFSLQSKSVSYTPTETAQSATITTDTGYDGLSSVAVSVGAISGTYVGSQVPTQVAQTIHPSTSAQTIASGKYLTGAQTVEAVTTNITADKIVSGFTAKIGSVTDDDCVASILGTASSGGTYGTKTITANGTYAAEDDGYDGYSEVTVDVPSGGGDTHIDIGVADDTVPNILNMFYALEHGTAKTGTFTLAQTIPNTSTKMFETGLTTVNGLFIADATPIRTTGSTPENTLMAIVFNPTTNTGDYAFTRLAMQMVYGTNTAGVHRGFLNRVSDWHITDGALYCTGTYNKHSTYTPFAAGHTYRWVAW